MSQSPSPDPGYRGPGFPHCGLGTVPAMRALQVESLSSGQHGTKLGLCCPLPGWALPGAHSSGTRLCLAFAAAGRNSVCTLMSSCKFSLSL